jgi:hypothetical protein
LTGLIVVGAIFSNPNMWGVQNPTAKIAGIPTSYIGLLRYLNLKCTYMRNCTSNVNHYYPYNGIVHLIASLTQKSEAYKIHPKVTALMKYASFTKRTVLYSRTSVTVTTVTYRHITVTCNLQLYFKYNMASTIINHREIALEYMRVTRADKLIEILGAKLVRERVADPNEFLLAELRRIAEVKANGQQVRLTSSYQSILLCL